MGFYKTSPITNIAKAICESLFAGRKSACGTKKDLNRAITCYKKPRNVIFSEKKRLRQCITHTQGIKITGTSFFLKKKRLRQCITHTQGIKIPGIQERLISQMALAIFVM